MIIANPQICPLCQQTNLCENLGEKDSGKTCWCNDPNIKFPKELIDKVPADKKDKACICQQCARAFSQTEGVSIFIPE